MSVKYLRHPIATSAPYVVGRWMVTGPDFTDGTGWVLCHHQDQKCQRCVASFTHQADAELHARLADAHDRQGYRLLGEAVWQSI